MKYAWLTDPHLDFLPSHSVAAFARSLESQDVEGLFITGDITVAPSLTATLNALKHSVPFPIYVILGNHDYYGSSIAKTREAMRAWHADTPNAHWMPQAGVVSLSNKTALIGHGGWGDGRIGDFMASEVMLNDYIRIEELQGNPKIELMNKLHDLGTEAAQFLSEQLLAAFKDHENVVMLTHVPPFLEASWHEEKIVLSEWTPHFTCGAVGDRISEIMRNHPAKNLRVLCGHTHGHGVAELLPNLHVFTGGAVYGEPALQENVEIE